MQLLSSPTQGARRAKSRLWPTICSTLMPSKALRCVNRRRKLCCLACRVGWSGRVNRPSDSLLLLRGTVSVYEFVDLQDLRLSGSRPAARWGCLPASSNPCSPSSGQLSSTEKRERQARTQVVFLTTWTTSSPRYFVNFRKLVTSSIGAPAGTRV